MIRDRLRVLVTASALIAGGVAVVLNGDASGQTRIPVAFAYPDYLPLAAIVAMLVLATVSVLLRLLARRRAASVRAPRRCRDCGLASPIDLPACVLCEK